MSGSSLEELSPFLRSQQVEQEHILEIHQRRRAALSSQMTELLADERWETYRRHVEELKKFHVQKEKSLQSVVLATLGLDNDETRKSRIDFLVAQARVAAYNECLTIVQALIENGKEPQ